MIKLNSRFRVFIFNNNAGFVEFNVRIFGTKRKSLVWPVMMILAQKKKNDSFKL